MTRWTGTAHLTRDPELVLTRGGTEICLMRIAVNRAGREGQAGFFAIKAFGAQAGACAQYLSTGREVAIEGRLGFEEFETKAGDYGSRVYLIANQVEFLASRRQQQAEAGHQPEQPAEPVPDREEARL